MISKNDVPFAAGTILVAACLLAGCRQSCTKPARSEPPETVLYIVIDTLRRDHLRWFGYDRNTSPTLDRLAREGLVLSNLVVHAPQTGPSTASLLTGLLPKQHGIQFWSTTMSFNEHSKRSAPALSAELTTIAERFQGAGFQTAGIVANPWLKGKFGFAQGFDDYYYVECFKQTVCNGTDINRLFEQLFAQRKKSKTFYYLHYMDVHAPYDKPHVPARFRPSTGRYARANKMVPNLPPEDLAYSMALYDEGILYMDSVLGQLLGFLEAEKMLRSTTIIITSDHGDEFYEHQGLGHGHTIFNELINSFAIIWRPGRFKPKNRVDYLPAVDLVATTLAIFDLETGPLAGRSVFSSKPDPNRPRDIISELGNKKALIHAPWKLIMDVPSGEKRFYRIGSRGEIEKEPEAPSPEIAELMTKKLVAFSKAPSLVEPKLHKLDPETIEQLRSLGYIQ